MPDVGVTGGEKLGKYLQKIADYVGPPQEVHVGFLAGSTEADGTSLPMIAAIQEFGAPAAGIPPRPFFRAMIAKHKDAWGDQLGKVLAAKDYDGTAALELMGEEIKGQLAESIVALTAPALSPVTLMLREMRHQDPDLTVTGKTVGEAAARVAAGQSYSGASTKPLVDTGGLLAGIGSEVVAS